MPIKSYKQDHPVRSKSTKPSSTQSASASPTRLLQRAEAGPDQITPHEVLHLQRTHGNRAVAQFMKASVPHSSVAPIQRTVDTAAEALFKNPHVKAVTNAHLTAKFQLEHTVTLADLANIQTAVQTLRVNHAAKGLRGQGLTDITTKTFTAKVAKDYNLGVGDLNAVKAALALIVANEETEEQRRARIFLSEGINASSGVSLTMHGVRVHLDNDQLKHQKQAYPIGDRTVGGGQKFKIDKGNPVCGSRAWHLANTLPYMAGWARDLGVMTVGQQENHGQGTPVGNVHYEGFCIFAGGHKYVMFHCYPEVGSKYDGGKSV